jgi:hypothetical protein
MSNVQGRSADDIRQSHEALKELWSKAGCEGDFETWFEDQLVDLPEVTDKGTEVHHYNANGEYIYSTWK